MGRGCRREYCSVTLVSVLLCLLLLTNLDLLLFLALLHMILFLLLFIVLLSMPSYNYKTIKFSNVGITIFIEYQTNLNLLQSQNWKFVIMNMNNMYLYKWASYISNYFICGLDDLPKFGRKHRRWWRSFSSKLWFYIIPDLVKISFSTYHLMEIRVDWQNLIVIW